jgi:hypothetical protein
MSGDYKPYIVRQGDYLGKLAYLHGFDADEVWNHERNTELRDLGRSPNILAPGDILYLPVKPKEGLSFTSGTSNRYRATVHKVKVSIVFKDDSRVLADEPYEVFGLGSEGSDGQTAERKTDGDGRIELELPVTTREISIVFPRQNVSYEVRVGDMDPENELSGIKKRLANLGFLVREIDSEAGDDQLSGAILAFQKKRGLPATGALDDATKKALKDEHGL